jgi:hypothetical protein
MLSALAAFMAAVRAAVLVSRYAVDHQGFALRAPYVGAFGLVEAEVM